MKKPAAWIGTSWIVAGTLVAGGAAPQAAPPASAAKAKEVVSLMAEQKLETFAARDGENTGRYVAVLVVPNVQLLLVSAKYTRDNDIEYSLYHKQYQNAYLDLRSGVFGSDRFFVDDAEMNGLIAAPGKNPQHDAITIDKDRHVFDGLHGDGKGRNAKKPLTDVYMKTYADADAKYSRMLDVLIEKLKANKVLDAPRPLR